ncbi:hypothetical protein F3Y22_tig00110627pilonHSYRG00067 [Hibiscus syriacus]|uniref:Uncharacterized protein n=1 Tax=Hibiscus syriacus TaxID=106335 RepID=A0A6A2ZYY0_HIBSY|nr:hypothetical protein F3Y22_tig00110627pilonHSYRG00067 [Hibiscus syriacus]
MKFNTEQEVYDFYNTYAREVGFSIRKSKGHKDQYGHWFNGKFQITEFIPDHNHALASPSKRMLLRSQRTINFAEAAELEIVDRSGLTPKESFEFLARKVGGVENLGFIPEDNSNSLRTRRTEEMKVGDAGGVLEYLQNMQHDDPNFSYAIQVDLDDFIMNIFWTVW